MTARDDLPRTKMICKYCGRVKMPRRSDGYLDCQACANKRAKLWRENNRERHNARVRERREDPAVKARRSEEQRKRLADPAARERHNALVRARSKVPEVRARRLEQNKRYWSEGDRPERLRALHRAYAKRERATPEGCIKHRLTNRLRKAMKFNRELSGPSLSVLGYTVADLCAHIERQFTCGMCWERLAEIDIDHIKPVVTFDLTTDEGIRQAFALENLQPLWKSDNRYKGSLHKGVHVRRKWRKRREGEA
jgi:hypothetical protein